MRELPSDGYLYEPKWDGFRCLAVLDGRKLELISHHGRPLARYFPELVAALERVEHAGVSSLRSWRRWPCRSRAIHGSTAF